VFTKPVHRGRGAARELIERLVEREAADGADAALLFSEIGPDYYARLGFHPLETPSCRCSSSRTRAAGRR
jgi:Predicted acetyltransferase